MIENSKTHDFGFTTKDNGGRTGFQLAKCEGNRVITKFLKNEMPSIAQ